LLRLSTHHCPTCHTPTDNPIIQKYIIETKDNIAKLGEQEKELKEKIERADNIFNAMSKKIEETNKNYDDQKDFKRQIAILESNLSTKVESLAIEEGRSFSVTSVISENDLLKYKNKFEETTISFETATKSYNYNYLLRRILGEDGVRKFVLSKILPFFNSKINQYLKIMGSDLTLVFNANLDAHIHTRNREERSYGGFSAGEKKRIDISVLMSLMDLAKLQNSVDTNILVLDEVLDTAMENFLTYLKDGFKVMYPDKAVYIITHRNTLSDDFYDKMIMLQKKDGFTTVDSIIDLRQTAS